MPQRPVTKQIQINGRTTMSFGHAHRSKRYLTPVSSEPRELLTVNVASRIGDFENILNALMITNERHKTGERRDP